MKIYQILLLIGVILASIATSFYLVKMISLLLRSKDSKKITDKELDNGVLLGDMDVIGTVSINNYNGILTPQIIIKDYTFREQ